jgi:hypothetical protein
MQLGLRLSRIVWLLMCTYLIFLHELVTGDADDVEGVSWWAGLGGIWLVCRWRCVLWQFVLRRACSVLCHCGRSIVCAWRVLVRRRGFWPRIEVWGHVD